MKNVFLLILALIFTSESKILNASDITNNMKKVVVTYLEKKLKIEDKEIIMHYYDEVTLSNVTIKEKTNSSGEVTFSLPGRADGASYVFAFTLTEGDLKQAFAMRIPPDTLYGGQDSILVILGKEKRSYIKNSGAPIQWMNFPIVGSKIEDNKTDINILKYNWATQEGENIKRMGFVNGGMKPISVQDIFLEYSLINIILN
jgi:hypothetical protein